MGEFDLIARYFKRPTRHAVLGVGDDCALLQPAPGCQLAVSSDMLVAGRHFLPDVDPRTLGHKALAVNLSDLAACGARPMAFTLALALPQADANWLERFSGGLFALAGAIRGEGRLLTPPAVLLGLALTGRILTVAVDGYAAPMLPPMIIEFVLVAILLIARRRLG